MEEVEEQKEQVPLVYLKGHSKKFRQHPLEERDDLVELVSKWPDSGLGSPPPEDTCPMPLNTVGSFMSPQSECEDI